jgi:hypothetical protein
MSLETHSKRLLSPLQGWDVLSAASQLLVRPKVGRYRALSLKNSIGDIQGGSNWSEYPPGNAPRGASNFLVFPCCRL